MRASACVDNGPVCVHKRPELSSEFRAMKGYNMGKPRTTNDLDNSSADGRAERPLRRGVAERSRRGDIAVIVLPRNSCISGTIAGRRCGLMMAPRTRTLGDDDAPGARGRTPRFA